MKVLLSTSPHVKHSAVLEADFIAANDLMYTFAPLGLLMLCAAIRKHLRITPILYDINGRINNKEIKTSNSFYESAAQSITAQAPDVIGFMTECDSYHHILQITKKVKEILPDCFIILGGPHATAVALPTMEKWNSIDAIVLGEGELTFVDLIKEIQKGGKVTAKGTIIRDNGAILKNASRELIQNLDELPFPAYDLYTPLAEEELFIEVGRGCPFNCTFCSTSPFWSRKHRVKSAQRIIEEIRYLKRLHNTKRVHFTHDLFTANQMWVEDVCNALIAGNLDVKWTCSSRIDTITEALISHMAAAGCNAIFFGIESGSERILDLIQKKIAIQKTYEVINICHKYGISPNAGLIVGFPFEDKESFSDTFRLYLDLMKLGTKPLHIFSYCPFAQSSLYQSLKDLECSEHFLDIPLPEPLNNKNRILIQSDAELFGSYFKPRLQSLIHLKPGMLYAVDEFAILVDAVRIPSIIIADAINGFEKMYFEWIEYIDQKNNQNKKASHRRYLGSPIDFCQFLGYTCKVNDLPVYLHSMLKVIEMNFKIGLRFKRTPPGSMATYRSKTSDLNLTNISLQSTVELGTVVEIMQVRHDITSILYALTIPSNFIAKPIKTNLVWHNNTDGNISLIKVNDFIYHIIRNTKGTACTLHQLIDSYIMTKAESDELDFAWLFDNVRSAAAEEIITIK